MRRALFVCVRSAGRSQLAAALYERLGGEARSAGSAPGDELAGGGRRGARGGPHRRRPADARGSSRGRTSSGPIVVTMGCGDACPVLPGKEYVDWDLPDPVGMCLEEVRELRAVIEARVSQLPR